MQRVATPSRGVLADAIPGDRVRDALVVVGGAALVGALAQVAIHLGFTPVPITGQTLGVLVVGCSLGFRRALASSALYVGLGLLGVPWFAAHTGGWVGASAGYLAGFVLASAVCGQLAELGGARGLRSAVPVMLVGEVCIYLPGVTWLGLYLHVGLGAAIGLGLVPFLAGDAVKVALAAGVLPGAWRLAGRRG
ncbi:MAG TPA: biotin transporter BioY [Candidatus Binatia bacterium]|nr:biotin transporter BioY [Candidatus Binatia bacterium]